MGRLLGVNALAAVGGASPIFYLLIMLTIGFTSGLTIITAQHVGAKDKKGIRQSVSHSIIICTVVCILVSGSCLLFLKQIIHAMNMPKELFKDAYDFIWILASGLPILVTFNLLSGFLRALGDSRTPLYFLILSAILNIFFNFAFIYWFKLGVKGSPYGTLLAVAISSLCCIGIIIKRFKILLPRREDWKINWKFLYKHLRISVPLSFQFVVITLGLILLQMICNTFGSNAIAGFIAAFRIEQLMTQPMIALGIAMATFVAQNTGACNIGNIKNGVKNISIISLVISGIIAFTMRIFGTDIVNLFVTNAPSEIIKVAVDYINITTLFYFFLGQIFIYRNAIQGLGKADIPLLSGITELLLRTYIALTLSKSLGYIGICYASPLAWVGACMVVFIGYHIRIKNIQKLIFQHA